MLKNYIKIAIRSFSRQKGFSMINILGLASGMAICMLIITLIKDQNDYDQFHTKKDRIYRIISDRTSNHSSTFATAPFPLYDEIVGKEATIEKALRIENWFSGDALYEEKTNSLEGIYAESAFFELFDFDLIYGDEKTALEEPFSILLTEEARKLYDLPENPVGEVLEFKDLGPFTIKGIIKTPDQKTHVNYNQAIVSFSSLRPLDQAGKVRSTLDDWKGTDYSFIYLLLNASSATKQLEANLKTVADRVYANEENYHLSFHLQSLSEIAPSKFLANDLFFTLPESALIFLSILALIVLLTAFFNYTNLSVARGLSRAVEVGVRKVIGAQRRQVFIQFTVEAMVMALLSLVLALGFLEILIIPQFKSLSFVQDINLDLILDPQLYGIFFLFSLVVGAVAGLLPATYLSAFQPVQVMKRLKNIKVFGSLTWRKVLIVGQFVISLVFLISISVIFDQTQYMMEKDLGFDQENMINLRLQGNDFYKIKNALSEVNGVNAISGSSIVPATGSNHGVYFKESNSGEKLEANRLWVDEAFISNWGLELIAGKNFKPGQEDNNQELIINEKIVAFLAYESPYEALGQSLIIDANSESGGYPATIVGVIKDFHYLTLDEPIGSLILLNIPSHLNYASIKIHSSDIKGTLSGIETAWKKLDPVHNIEYEFLDEAVNRHTVMLFDLLKILSLLAIVAVLITCLGFLGIAAYSVEVRTKEIGIRKILGAGLDRIIWILSKGLIYPLLIAILIATPAAWYLNDALWLNNFANRVNWNFFNLGFGVCLIALISLTIIFSQAYRIARQNPVESLRIE